MVRTYHSGALLLPSARVVTLGGDSRTRDCQVLEPHYWGATRPGHSYSSQTTIPISYGTPFTVNFTLTSPRTLQSACLIAPGSVTHSHDPNQRLVELSISNATTTSAILTPPANPTLAPYGYYMLFLVDSAGEVSTAVWTQLL